MLKPHFLVHWLRTGRPFHWAKNLLVFWPLIALGTRKPADFYLLVKVFVEFSACAAAVYALNDLFDRQGDSGHPWKSKRPVAAGLLSPAAGVVGMLCWLGLSFGLAASGPAAVMECLAAYFLLNILYSAFLKPVPLANVLLLAVFYPLRIEAGYAALRLNISWAEGLSFYSLFLSLALLKRFSEFRLTVPAAGRSMPIAWMGIGALLVSLTLFTAFFLSGQSRVPGMPATAALICFLALVAWSGKAWVVALFRNPIDDLIAFLFNDWFSYIILVAILALAAWMA